MRISSTQLNWDQATVLEFKYIHYLANMLHERTNKIGLPTYEFSLTNYEPGGFFRFKQLYDIYIWTIFLGQYIYFNDANFNDAAFRNGKRCKHFGYTIKEMSDIANFEFNKNPLIPNQRINYYDRFLKPLYLVLKEFKKIYINSFIANDRPKLYYGFNDPEKARTKKYNIEQDLVGNDLLNFYTFQHAVSSEMTLVPSGYVRTEDGNPFMQTGYSLTSHDVCFLGGMMEADYIKTYSFGYIKEEKEPTPPGPPDPPVNGHWEFESGTASYTADWRWFPEPPGGASADDVNLTFSVTSGSNYNIVFTKESGISHYYEAQNYPPPNRWDLEATYTYPEDAGNFNWLPTPVARFYEDGTIEIYYLDQRVRQAPQTGATTNSANLYIEAKQGVGDENGELIEDPVPGCNVTINLVFVYDPVPEPDGGGGGGSGDTIKVREYDYASNFEGLKFDYYAILPSTQIACSVPLVSGCPFQLYMYAFTYPLETKDDYHASVHSTIRNYFYWPEDINSPLGSHFNENSPTYFGYFDTYLRTGPYINLQPFGNFFLLNSGTLGSTFNTFNIELPQKFPYNESVFNQFPLEFMGDSSTYYSVDYVPYSYDTNLWRRIGSTPEKSQDGTHYITQGSVLQYIGPTSKMNDDSRRMFYRMVVQAFIDRKLFFIILL